MTTRVYTDRSRCEQYARCPRSRWLAYHQDGMGITSARKSLPLAVGGAVHQGLAVLLRAMIGDEIPKLDETWRKLEDGAVKAALVDFAEFDAGRLETDVAETDAQDLTAFDDVQKARVRSDVDQYLYDEQRALVEAMVRAYARRRLRPLLEQYEVLEVEREGQWLLSSWPSGECTYDDKGHPVQEHARELWFMSRPDALLRDRQSNDLYIQSFKTGASWDLRKGKDAEHDAQGLSEGVEIEKRLGAAWHRLHDDPNDEQLVEGLDIAMLEYLRGLKSPPRILGIRYEFLWKGQRREDRDLTSRFGVTCYAQKSHLIRGYLNAGMASGDEAWNWSWDYVKDTGETSKLYWKAWKGAAIWESMPVAKWIDMLDATVETVGEEGTAKGWSGPAQATGFTGEHPLDLVFHPPIIVYRNEDDARDWIEQVESQEVEIAERVARVQAAQDEGERRSLLNRYFRQSRHSCIYPSQCQFVAICYGGEDIRRDPLATKLYQIREANHPIETSGDEVPRG
jgi:hypothetical protein